MRVRQRNQRKNIVNCIIIYKYDMPTEGGKSSYRSNNEHSDRKQILLTNANNHGKDMGSM